MRRIRYDERIAYKLAARNGHLNVIEILDEKYGLGWTKETVKESIIYGQLEVLKYFYDLNWKYVPSNKIRLAARGGHLEIIKYIFYERRQIAGPEAVISAIEQNHFHVVKYFLEERDMYCSLNFVDTAVTWGHLDMLKYLLDMVEKRQEGELASKRATINMASFHADPQIISLLKDQDGDSMAVNGAGTNLDVIKHVMRKGTPCSDWAFEEAASYGHLDIIKFLYEKGQPCTARAFELSAMNGELEMVRYFTENGQTWPPELLERLDDHGEMEIVDFLYDVQDSRMVNDLNI